MFKLKLFFKQISFKFWNFLGNSFYQWKRFSERNLDKIISFCDWKANQYYPDEETPAIK